jgi:hypothetical protein
MLRPQEALVFLSSERWDSTSDVWRLPRQCAREHRVVVVEPPMFDATEPELELRREELVIAVPHFEPDTTADVVELAQRRMLERVLDELGSHTPILWYRDADALGFTHHVEPRAIVYDPAWSGPASFRDLLLRQHADVVIADPTRDLEWAVAWTLLERVMSSRMPRAA